MAHTLDELLAALPGLALEHQAELADMHARFLLETKQGRRVYLTLDGGELTIAPTGSEPDCTVTADEADLLAMMAGKLNPAKALLFGKVKVKGNAKPLMALVSMLR